MLWLNQHVSLVRSGRPLPRDFDSPTLRHPGNEPITNTPPALTLTPLFFPPPTLLITTTT